MKALVLTSEPISAHQLREALPGDLDPNEVEVMVVAPALQQNPLKFWFSDADEAIARAEEVRRSTVEQLGRAGMAASGDTGESDPVEAIQDALATFSADRIILFTHRDDSSRYREDVDVDEVRRRFGLPVDQATV
jgi:hypothetical protein